MAKTSDTHPLRIDSLQIPHVKGELGLTFCPGKKGKGLYSGNWDRDLDKDLSEIEQWGAQALVSLIEDHEFDLLGVADFSERVARKNLQWFNLPIVDVSTPDDRFESDWATAGYRIRGILCRGGKVVLHCRGGLGRTGLLAARILVDFGLEPDQAMEQVRQARPGAIETLEQEQHVHAYHAKHARRTLDHYLGCLLGGAVGDALGGAIEFDSLAEIRKCYGPEGIQDYAEAFGKVGAITDDTQMTLFTAEGLLRAVTRAQHKGIGPSFVSCTHTAYRRWLVTQGETDNSPVPMDGWLAHTPELHSRRAPGNTCLSSLRHDRPFLLNNSSSRHNDSKGCGAVMRMAPVGLLFQSHFMCRVMTPGMRDRETFIAGRDLGYLTHGHPSGYLPAACLAMMIGRIIDGDGLNEAIDNTLDILNEHPGAEETEAAVKKAIEFAADPDLPHNAETVEKLGEEWVGEEALAIAIYCALVAGNDFDLGIRLAVNHSGDSDSTGAIAGNLLGALLGRKAIAERWLVRLELRQVIEQVATDLFLGFEDDDDWWRRYPGY